MSDTRPVMYATDFSPASLAAFPEAIAIAKATAAELIVVHVLPSPFPLVAETTYVDQKTWDRLFATALAEANRNLDDVLAKARDAGVRTSGFVIDAGLTSAPAAEIVRAATDKAVSMLVLGTHGRTGVARFFLGSVAARVVATASCPVLTVRAHEPAQVSAAA
jgi:nucleotide-binding universal stress UspA family protein